MKALRITFITLLTLFVVGAFSGNAFGYEPPTEFRGIKWGTAFDSVKSEMTLAESSNNECGCNFYTRKNDKLTIGAAKLETIVYAFYQDRFASVLMYCKGFINKGALLDALTAKFGDPYQPNEYIETYYWGLLSPVTWIYFDYNQFSEKSTISFRYVPILNEQNQCEKEQADKGKQDF